MPDQIKAASTTTLGLIRLKCKKNNFMCTVKRHSKITISYSLLDICTVLNHSQSTFSIVPTEGKGTVDVVLEDVLWYLGVSQTIYLAELSGRATVMRSNDCGCMNSVLPGGLTCF